MALTVTGVTLHLQSIPTRCRVLKRWDALLEYRMLNVSENDGRRSGVLLGVDRLGPMARVVRRGGQLWANFVVQHPR